MHCVMVLALRALTSLGLSPQRSLAPLFSLLHIVTATLCALLLPSRTTSMLISPFLLLLPSSPTLPRLANPKICSSTISSVLSPMFGLRPCSPMYWATASTLVVLSSFCLPEFLLKLLLPWGAGHPLLSYSTGTVWMKYCPCPPQKLIIKQTSIVLPLFLKTSVLHTKSPLP